MKTSQPTWVLCASTFHGAESKFGGYMLGHGETFMACHGSFDASGLLLSGPATCLLAIGYRISPAS